MQNNSLRHYNTTIRAKIAAAVTLLLFLVSSLINPQLVDAFVHTPQPVVGIELPQHLARITAEHVVPQKETPFVILIQDAHANYEAQKNIHAMLEVIGDTYDVDTVCIEGASGDVDLSLFSAFPLIDEKKRIIDMFVKKGDFTGAESYAICADRQVSLIGVDHPKKYVDNVKTYTAITAFQDTARTFLAALDKKVCSLRTVICSEDLCDLLIKKETFFGSEEDSLAYLRFLYGMVEKYEISLSRFKHFQALKDIERYQSKINEASIAKETRDLIDDGLLPVLSDEESDRLAFAELEYMAGRSTAYAYYGVLKELACAHDIDIRAFTNLHLYYLYLALVNDIDADGLLEDRKQIEERLIDLLAQTDDEKTVVRLTNHLRVLKNLFALKATPEDIAYMRRYRKDLHTEAFVSFFVRHAEANEVTKHLKHGSDKDPSLSLRMTDEQFSIEENLLLIQKFYTLAEQRESTLVGKTVDVIKKRKKKAVVLFAGGFHTPGLEKRLQRRGISYVVVAPRITELPKEDLYHKIMTSYDKYFGIKEGVQAGTAPLLKPFLYPALQKQFLPEIMASFSESMRHIVYSKTPMTQEMLAQLVGKRSFAIVEKILSLHTANNKQDFLKSLNPEQLFDVLVALHNFYVKDYALVSLPKQNGREVCVFQDAALAEKIRDMVLSGDPKKIVFTQFDVRARTESPLVQDASARDETAPQLLPCDEKMLERIRVTSRALLQARTRAQFDQAATDFYAMLDDLFKYPKMTAISADIFSWVLLSFENMLPENKRTALLREHPALMRQWSFNMKVTDARKAKKYYEKIMGPDAVSEWGFSFSKKVYVKLVGTEENHGGNTAPTHETNTGESESHSSETPVDDALHPDSFTPLAKFIEKQLLTTARQVIELKKEEVNKKLSKKAFAQRIDAFFKRLDMLLRAPRNTTISGDMFDALTEALAVIKAFKLLRWPIKNIGNVMTYAEKIEKAWKQYDKTSYVKITAAQINRKSAKKRKTQTVSRGSHGSISQGTEAVSELDAFTLVASLHTDEPVEKRGTYRFVDDSDPLFVDVGLDEYLSELRRMSEEEGGSADFGIVIGPAIVKKRNDFIFGKFYRDKNFLFLAEDLLEVLIEIDELTGLSLAKEYLMHEVLCRGGDHHYDIIELLRDLFPQNGVWTEAVAERIADFLGIEPCDEYAVDERKGWLGFVLRFSIEESLGGIEQRVDDGELVPDEPVSVLAPLISAITDDELEQLTLSMQQNTEGYFMPHIPVHNHAAERAAYLKEQAARRHKRAASAGDQQDGVAVTSNGEPQRIEESKVFQPSTEKGEASTHVKRRTPRAYKKYGGVPEAVRVIRETIKEYCASKHCVSTLHVVVASDPKEGKTDIGVWVQKREYGFGEVTNVYSKKIFLAVNKLQLAYPYVTFVFAKEDTQETIRAKLCAAIDGNNFRAHRDGGTLSIPVGDDVLPDAVRFSDPLVSSGESSDVLGFFKTFMPSLTKDMRPSAIVADYLWNFEWLTDHFNKIYLSFAVERTQRLTLKSSVTYSHSETTNSFYKTIRLPQNVQNALAVLFAGFDTCEFSITATSQKEIARLIEKEAARYAGENPLLRQYDAAGKATVEKNDWAEQLTQNGRANLYALERIYETLKLMRYDEKELYSDTISIHVSPSGRVMVYAPLCAPSNTNWSWYWEPIESEYAAEVARLWARMPMRGTARSCTIPKKQKGDTVNLLKRLFVMHAEQQERELQPLTSTDDKIREILFAVKNVCSVKDTFDAVRCEVRSDGVRVIPEIVTRDLEWKRKDVFPTYVRELMASLPWKEKTFLLHKDTDAASVREMLELDNSEIDAQPRRTLRVVHALVTGVVALLVTLDLFRFGHHMRSGALLWGGVAFGVSGVLHVLLAKKAMDDLGAHLNAIIAEPGRAAFSPKMHMTLNGVYRLLRGIVIAHEFFEYLQEVDKGKGNLFIHHWLICAFHMCLAPMLMVVGAFMPLSEPTGIVSVIDEEGEADGAILQENERIVSLCRELEKIDWYTENYATYGKIKVIFEKQEDTGKVITKLKAIVHSEGIFAIHGFSGEAVYSLPIELSDVGSSYATIKNLIEAIESTFGSIRFDGLRRASLPLFSDDRLDEYARVINYIRIERALSKQASVAQTSKKPVTLMAEPENGKFVVQYRIYPKWFFEFPLFIAAMLKCVWHKKQTVDISQASHIAWNDDHDTLVIYYSRMKNIPSFLRLRTEIESVKVRCEDYFENKQLQNRLVPPFDPVAGFWAAESMKERNTVVTMLGKNATPLLPIAAKVDRSNVTCQTMRIPIADTPFTLVQYMRHTGLRNEYDAYCKLTELCKTIPQLHMFETNAGVRYYVYSAEKNRTVVSVEKRMATLARFIENSKPTYAVYQNACQEVLDILTDDPAAIVFLNHAIRWKVREYCKNVLPEHIESRGEELIVATVSGGTWEIFRDLKYAIGESGLDITKVYELIKENENTFVFHLSNVRKAALAREAQGGREIRNLANNGLQLFFDDIVDQIPVARRSIFSSTGNFVSPVGAIGYGEISKKVVTKQIERIPENDDLMLLPFMQVYYGEEMYAKLLHLVSLIGKGKPFYLHLLRQMHAESVTDFRGGMREELGERIHVTLFKDLLDRCHKVDRFAKRENIKGVDTLFAYVRHEMQCAGDNHDTLIAEEKEECPANFTRNSNLDSFMYDEFGYTVRDNEVEEEGGYLGVLIRSLRAEREMENVLTSAALDVAYDLLNAGALSLCMKDEVDEHVVSIIMDAAVQAGKMTQAQAESIQTMLLQALKDGATLRHFVQKKQLSQLRGVLCIPFDECDAISAKDFKDHWNSDAYERVIVLAGKNDGSYDFIRNDVARRLGIAGKDVAVQFVSDLDTANSLVRLVGGETIGSYDFINVLGVSSVAGPTREKMTQLWADAFIEHKNKVRILSGTTENALKIGNVLATVSYWLRQDAGGKIVPTDKVITKLGFYLLNSEVNELFAQWMQGGVFLVDKIRSELTQAMQEKIRMDIIRSYA